MRGYYRKLKPDTAWVLRRRLVPSDVLRKLVPVKAELDTGQEAESMPVSLMVSTPPLLPVHVPAEGPRPANVQHARSFQERGPEREWNDLPEDVLAGTMLKAPSHLGSREGSAASSRSSSRSGAEGRGKKKRVYPPAAFGS